MSLAFVIGEEINEVDFWHDLVQLSYLQFCLGLDAIQSQVQLPPFVLNEVVAADSGANAAGVLI